MKIAIITALWQRPHTWELFAESVNQLKAHGLNIEVCAAISDSDAMQFCNIHGWKWGLIENFPLGRKWNTALKLAESLNPDYVLAMGQDDICDHVYLTRAVSTGRDFIGSIDCYFNDLRTGQFLYWSGYGRGARKGEPIGAGRVFSKKLLNAAKWKLWPDDRNGSLDHGLMERLTGIKHTSHLLSCHAHKLFLCDFKDGDSLTKFQQWPNSHFQDFNKYSHILTDKQKEIISKFRYDFVNK